MLSPVHLRANKLNSGNYQFSWIRRGAQNADNWEGSEIPLNAREEKYTVSILDIADTIKREITTTSHNISYTKLMKIADFGSDETDFYIEVAQLNNNGDLGSPKNLKISNI